jgi:1,4-dihydroxy-2-naphthoate octaprenyltransferase
MNQLRRILRLIRPVQLLLALLTYSLGLGIARYLGITLRPESGFAGMAIVVLLQAASSLFIEYFRPFNEPVFPGPAPQTEISPLEREQLHSFLLVLAAAFLAAAGMLVFLLQHGGFLHSNSAFLLLIFVLLSLANAVPPVRLVNRGFGELVNAYLLASLTPSLAFVLQADYFHRLVSLFTFPLFLIALACFLALDFPNYAEDLKYERRSLLVALTWQQAVPMHNLLLITAYFFLAAVPFMGVNFQLVWPTLLPLPLAIYQIFALRSLAGGAKPLWTLFSITTLAIFGLTAYLLALTFWLH